MSFKSFLSAIGAALFALAVIFLPVTAPAFAASISINNATTAASLTLPAKQTTNLPGFTNDSDKPVKLELRVEGKWSLSRTYAKGAYNSVDGDGSDRPYTASVIKFPEVKIGAIVAEIKDVKGQLKSLISGKEQTFELEPGESVSFIINDDPNFYENNNGEAIINYSVISSCGK